MMKRLIQHLRLAGDAIQRRFRRSRPGSVLILVVALLVLVALAGTAMMATARTDRYTAAQHTTNTEVDLLVDGVVRMLKAELVDDLFTNNIFRPPTAEPPPVPAPSGF